MSNLLNEHPRLIAETYHSTLETCLYRGTVAVIKKSRNLDDPRTKARWHNEVEALKLAGTHKNITSLLTSSATPTSLTLTLRLEPGASLDTLIDDHARCTLARAASASASPSPSPADPTDASRIHHQIASALAHLHARRLVHDDVKPENILWDTPGKRAVLVDFGATLNFNNLTNLNNNNNNNNHPLPTSTTTTTTTKTYEFNPSGTPSYAPPEFLRRAKSPQGKGDVWALGVTMLFVWGYVRLPDGDWLLPGVVSGDDPPGAGPSRGARHREQMQEWLRQVAALRDGGAGDERPGLRAMLRDDPDQRIGSADLERLLSGGS